LAGIAQSSGVNGGNPQRPRAASHRELGVTPSSNEAGNSRHALGRRG
jgi:hypothetical protein